MSVGVGQRSLRRPVAVWAPPSPPRYQAALPCLASPCELESSECQGGRGEGTGVGHLLAYQCRSALVYVPVVRRLMRDVKTVCYVACLSTRLEHGSMWSAEISGYFSCQGRFGRTHSFWVQMITCYVVCKIAGLLVQYRSNGQLSPK